MLPLFLRFFIGRLNCVYYEVFFLFFILFVKRWNLWHLNRLKITILKIKFHWTINSDIEELADTKGVITNRKSKDNQSFDLMYISTSTTTILTMYLFLYRKWKRRDQWIWSWNWNITDKGFTFWLVSRTWQVVTKTLQYFLQTWWFNSSHCEFSILIFIHDFEREKTLHVIINVYLEWPYCWIIFTHCLCNL